MLKRVKQLIRPRTNKTCVRIPSQVRREKGGRCTRNTQESEHAGTILENTAGLASRLRRVALNAAERLVSRAMAHSALPWSSEMLNCCKREPVSTQWLEEERRGAHC